MTIALFRIHCAWNAKTLSITLSICKCFWFEPMYMAARVGLYLASWLNKDIRELGTGREELGHLKFEIWGGRRKEK